MEDKRERIENLKFQLNCLYGLYMSIPKQLCLIREDFANEIVRTQRELKELEMGNESKTCRNS